MVQITTSTTYVCPNCSGHDVELFYEANNVPVHSCVLLSTEQEALNFSRGDINLGFCNNCGFISNFTFDPSLLDYTVNYEDQQSFLPTFNLFLKSLANRLVEKYDLHDKEILEIGCGKGDFLILLSRARNVIDEKKAFKMANLLKHEVWQDSSWIINPCLLGVVELNTIKCKNIINDKNI